MDEYEKKRVIELIESAERVLRYFRPVSTAGFAAHERLEIAARESRPMVGLPTDYKKKRVK
jgi:hypothetical protein